MIKCINCMHKSICVIRQTIVMHPEIDAEIKACQHYMMGTDGGSREEFKFDTKPPVIPAFKPAPRVNCVSEKISDEPPAKVDEVIKPTAPIVHETIQPKAEAQPPIFDSLSRMSNDDIMSRANDMDPDRINNLSARIHALQGEKTQRDIVRKGFSLTAEDDGVVKV